MEKLQQDSASISLEQHKQELIGALEAEKGGGGAPAPAAGGGDDVGQIFTEVMMAATGGTALGVAISVADDLASTNKNTHTNTGSMFVNTKSKRQGSLFVGGGVKSNDKASRITPLVPMSYGDKKAAMKSGKMPITSRQRDDIAARARLSSMSLTGRSLTGAKPSPIRGASVRPSDMKAIKINEIMAELSVTNRTMANPYENTKRLVQDYKQGVDAAENTVQRIVPEKIKNAAPKVAAQMQPQGPKGSSAS